MDSDGLPLVGSEIDFHQVPSLDRKRLLAFVNHFVTHSVDFLNRFATISTRKLHDLDLRLHRMQIALDVLDSKLSSIPSLDHIKESTDVTIQQNTTTMPVDQSNDIPVSEQSNNQSSQDQQKKDEVHHGDTNVESKVEKVITVAEDPNFASFFRMLKMGIHELAVKQKMQMSGIDPTWLDRPNEPSPYSAAGDANAGKQANENVEVSDNDSFNDDIDNKDSSDFSENESFSSTSSFQ